MRTGSLPHCLRIVREKEKYAGRETSCPAHLCIAAKYLPDEECKTYPSELLDSDNDDAAATRAAHAVGIILIVSTATARAGVVRRIEAFRVAHTATADTAKSRRSRDEGGNASTAAATCGVDLLFAGDCAGNAVAATTAVVDVAPCPGVMPRAARAAAARADPLAEFRTAKACPSFQ